MSTQASSVDKPKSGTASMAGFFKSHLREYGILIALVVIMALFQFLTDGILLKPINLTNLFLQNSYIIIMALGMLMVIVCGHIDLSVGSVLGFIGALAAVMMVNYDISYPVTFVACLLVGTLIGAAQGYWVAYYRIPAFIVTLAGMLVFKGLTLWLLNGQSVGPFPDQFQKLSTGFLPDVFPSDNFHITSMLLGIATSALLIYFNIRTRYKQAQYGSVLEPIQFFVVRNALIAVAILYITYLLSTYRAQCADPDGLADFHLHLCHSAHHLRSSHLRHRWQRESGHALGHQHATPDVPDLCQHGHARCPGRHGFRRPPEHGHAQSRCRF